MSNLNITGADGRMRVYVENNPQRFFDLPEAIQQRDHKGRIETKNVQVMFNNPKLDHLVVVTGVLCKDDEWAGKNYKKGWKSKLDAHTRAEYWNSKKFKKELMPEKLLVIEYQYDSLKEMAEAYFRHNSHDSVETSADKFRGIFKKVIDPETRKVWKKLSSPFQKGTVATLTNAAHVELFDFMYPGKNNRGMDSITTDGESTKSVLKDDLRRVQCKDFEFAMQVYDWFIKKGLTNGTVRTIKDPAFGAALLMYLWLHGSEEYDWKSVDDFVYGSSNGLNNNVRVALEKYICTEQYKGDPQRTDKNGDPEIHMEYPVNRLIRDCQPAPEAHEKSSIFHPTIIARLRFGHISESVSQAFCDIMAIHNSTACKKRKLPSDVINETCKIVNKNPYLQEKIDEFKQNRPTLWKKRFAAAVTNDDDDEIDFDEDSVYTDEAEGK